MIRRLLAVALSVATVIAASSEPALAGSAGRATGAVTASTTPRWGVTDAAVNGTATAGTITSFTFLLVSLGPQYFDVVNTGTTTLVATTYVVGLSTSGIPLSSVSLTLRSCSLSAGWNTASGTCSGGTITTISPAFSGASSSVDSTNAPLASGSRVHFQATISGLSIGQATATIQTQVSSKTPRDIRATATTNH